VSLPFADHCEPIFSTLSGSQEFVDWLRSECQRSKWKYIELRPRGQKIDSLQVGFSYCFHELDLEPSLEGLFQGLHKNSIQRKIRRAEREKLTYEVGRSSELVDQFYRLLLITRRRHQLFPQPRIWFQNLIECLGDKLQIRVAGKNGRPLAAMLTLRHGKSMVYKYGCSDEQFHNLGGMSFLFWKFIEEAKTSGAEEIDFGRSDLDNEGLMVFKDRLGAGRKLLTYYRYANRGQEKAVSPIGLPAIRRFFSILPDAVLSAGGKLLYRHMG
jgi:lipid II:glycine glycyltransferase (peptidoglycan interpeptide bridge formation enzyme)